MTSALVFSSSVWTQRQSGSCKYSQASIFLFVALSPVSLDIVNILARNIFEGGHPCSNRKYQSKVYGRQIKIILQTQRLGWMGQCAADLGVSDTRRRKASSREESTNLVLPTSCFTTIDTTQTLKPKSRQKSTNLVLPSFCFIIYHHHG